MGFKESRGGEEFWKKKSVELRKDEGKREIEDANQEAIAQGCVLEGFPPSEDDIQKTIEEQGSWRPENMHKVMKDGQFTGVAYMTERDSWENIKIEDGTGYVSKEEFDTLVEALENVSQKIIVKQKTISFQRWFFLILTLKRVEFAIIESKAIADTMRQAYQLSWVGAKKLELSDEN